MQKDKKNEIIAILDEMDKEKIIKKHPIPKGDYDFELKLHYLYGVALVMNVDGEIHELEKNFLIRLINTFNIQEEVLNDLIEFSKNPIKKTMNEIVKNIHSNSCSEIFLTDCFIMACKDKTMRRVENEMLQKLKKQLETSNSFTFSTLRTLKPKIAANKIALSTVYNKVLAKKNIKKTKPLKKN